MKHSDAAVGMLVVTPMGHIARITFFSDGGRCWLQYVGFHSHLDGVTLDIRLLRPATPRELMAAGVEA